MLYYQTKFGCEQTSSLEDIVKIVIFWLYKPRCDLDIEGNEPNFFAHETPPHDNTPQYQVWLKKKMVEQFRRRCADVIEHTDRTTDGWSGSDPPPHITSTDS